MFVSKRLKKLSSNLLQRGLDDLDSKKLTIEDIRSARQERPELSGLTEEAVLLVLEQPAQWKMRLFLQVMGDEIQKYHYMRLHSPRQHVSNEKLSVANRSDISKVLDWHKDKMNAMRGNTRKLADVFNEETFQKALHKSSDHATDAPILIMSAIEMGLAYRKLCVWQVKVRSVNRNARLDRLCKATAAMADEALQNLENYAPHSLAKIKEAMALPKPGQAIDVDLTLKFTMSEAAVDTVANEMDKLADYL